MTTRLRLALGTLLLALCLPVTAQDSLPGEPEVTIREDGERLIEEYRLNGFLYAIKITPENGPPYFLVAVDDEGNFARADQVQQELRIPSWKIFEW